MKKLDIGDPNATMIAGYFEDAFGVPPSQRTTRAVDGTYYHMWRNTPSFSYGDILSEPRIPRIYLRGVSQRG